MNSTSLNNLWSYLQGLPLSANNQRWLGEKLMEAASNGKGKTIKKTARSCHQRIYKHTKGLSDDELAKRLAQYPPLTDADFPEVSAEDYANFAKNHSGRISKGLEKWL